MKTFTNTTKMAATMVASLAVLAGAANAREVVSPRPNLEARVMELGQVHGLWAANCPIALGNSTAWAQGDDAEASALHDEGFALGVRELLRSDSGDIGVSVALRFRSAAGALADLDRREQLAGRQGYAVDFAVPDAPSVRAYAVRTAGSTTVHAAFVRGTDEYGLAVEAARDADMKALERAVANAARREARPCPIIEPCRARMRVAAC